MIVRRNVWSGELSRRISNFQNQQCIEDCDDTWRKKSKDKISLTYEITIDKIVGDSVSIVRGLREKIIDKFD